MDEIYLKRPHSEFPWGFRIVGGAELKLPIIVSKVIEGSIAESSGLRQEVIIERVNNVPISSLTHAEVNEIIIAAGNELLLTIIRENLENYISTSPALDKKGNAGIYSIEENEENDLEEISSLHADDYIGREGDESYEIKREYGIPMIVDNQNKIRELSSYQITPEYRKQPVSEKRWSTFLQKPKNPPPRPFNAPPPIPKENLYRVVIKKSKKNDEDQQLSQESEEIPVTVKSDENANEPTRIDENLKNFEDKTSPPLAQEISCNMQGNELQDEEIEENLVPYGNETELNTDHTYSEVVPEITEPDVCPDDTDEAFEGLISETAEMEGVLSETLSDIHEESEHIEEEIEEESEPIKMEENNIESNYESESETGEDDDDGSQTGKAVIRPIILPGGRKWVDPDDAVPVRMKTRKMSDNSICSAIETFSEVIVGKTKGINFMKYTPPAKNLDYLQKSSVYRLIHEMEPPVKGISVRPEKVLAEQDYYSGDEN